MSETMAMGEAVRVGETMAMGETVRLSVCIPTYNFGAYIGETLHSILPQVVEGVEVVVLDGGSTDDTAAVVEALQKRWPRLRYERRAERGGIDRDMAYTVDAARGEYCWLFCADDVMKEGAIARMLAHLDSGCDVYLCGLTLCALDMTPLGEHPVARIATDAQFDLGSTRERRRYFRRAKTTTAFFSFAGSLTFRRSRWEAIPLNEQFVGSLWAHVARLFQMIPGGLRLHYIPESYLFKRSGNDSFMDDGLIKRYAIATDGYDRLAQAFFPRGSPEARHIHRVLANEFPVAYLLELKFKSERERPEDVETLNRMATIAYIGWAPRSVVYRLLYDHTPRAVYMAAQAGYRGARAVLAKIRSFSVGRT
jgi:abequosyltransferase